MDIEKLIFQPESKTYDQQPMNDLTKNNLQLDLIAEVFKSVQKQISNEKLQSLGILVPVGKQLVPSIGGMILFGENRRLFPEVRCARFLGESKAQILDQFDVEGTIVQALDPVLKFIARNTRLAADFQDYRRKDIPEYSPIALREALINAFAHTDYSMSGSSIQVAIFDDRLEIQNPGMLPFGFTMEDLKNGISRARNRVIAHVFHELKLMEQWGSGYKRIVDACQQEGYPIPQWEELGTFIRVTFYPHSKTAPSSFSLGEESFSERELAILSLLKTYKRLPFREIYQRITPHVSERTLKYDLASLKRKKAIRSQGKGRAVIWEVS